MKMKPEWKEIASGVYWCRGCGCIKLLRKGKKLKYETPRREKERRAHAKSVSGRGYDEYGNVLYPKTL